MAIVEYTWYIWVLLDNLQYIAIDQESEGQPLHRLSSRLIHLIALFENISDGHFFRAGWFCLQGHEVYSVR